MAILKFLFFFYPVEFIPWLFWYLSHFSPAVFFPEENLYKSMEVNLLRKLYASSGYEGTLSALVTEHPSSPQWRLSGAVTSQTPLTPCPTPIPACTASFWIIRLHHRWMERVYWCLPVVAHSIPVFSLSVLFGLAAKHFFLHQSQGQQCLAV